MAANQDESDASTRHEEFIDRLTLARIDRDIFTGSCHAGAPLRAFGGQVAAQALVAAGRTIEQDDRHVHSLHGYFLRPGRTDEPIVYLVERPRDGRSFSTRLVRAVQHGETIFTMSASFAVREPGPSHQVAMPLAPAPESLPQAQLPTASVNPELRQMGFPEERQLDLRLLDRETAEELTGGAASMIAWFRTTRPLPDDPLLQVCTLTYFSDITLAGTTLRSLGPDARDKFQLASLDHAMWFHDVFRADEWVLFVQDSTIAHGARSLARGQFFSHDGVLVASAVQEVLMRPRVVAGS